MNIISNKIASVKHFLLLLLVVCGASAIAQDEVDINLDIRHAVNGVSEFDRAKYMQLHASAVDKEWPSEEVKEQFLTEYDVYLGRNNGSMPWNLSITKQDPDKAGWPSVTHLQELGEKAINDYKNNTNAHKYEDRRGNYMMGGQPVMYPNQSKEIGPNGAKWFMAKDGFQPLAEFYANYIKYFHGTGGATGLQKPKYFEVMNEPFVHSDDVGSTNANIAELHRVAALRVKELNPEVKVGGYTAAHPAYEAADFKHWENNWKLFMDVAGAEMDFFSLHLYDNDSATDPEDKKYRSGSNVEAILDMVEHYGFLKFGEVKPFVLSEYGALASDEYGTTYTKERDWRNIRSFSTMLMQFLEKPDVIDVVTPFVILKANWWKHESGNKYPHRLFRQKKELAGETGDDWVYTEIVKFFQLWSNVNGTRVDTKSNNLDTQVDTYVDGKKVYVIVNNMHLESRTVNLDVKGIGNANIESIYIKHLHADNNGIPELNESTVYSPVNRIEIGREATVILEYTFDKAIDIPESSQESKYYADKYFQRINSGQQMNFSITGVDKGEYGEAVLRLGLGRDHGKSLKPNLRVNGTVVEIPDNVRGCDQKARDRFFGVVEIPIAYELLNADNDIQIQFNDGGGHISSLSLQTFKFSKEISRNDLVTGIDGFTKKNKFQISPNPVQSNLMITGLDVGEYQFSIFNISGMRIKNARLDVHQEEAKVFVEDLPKGMYLFNVTGKQSSQSVKFMKL